MVFGSLGLGLTPGNTTGVSEGIEVPIGAILPFAKTLTNTPALPSRFVECNGQVLSDGDSVYDGVTIPNLNGNNNFLRGNSTSGGTGGAATINIAHSHDFAGEKSVQAGVGSSVPDNGASPDTDSQLSTTQSILPPYYNVVWVIRIK